ncbi:hypothetical protein [Bdellovibrio sp.]|uniref:hypothetical protein n=1 Tax=Bdellovibrio sp. TaxID=28201 RepID=UPI003221480E
MKFALVMMSMMMAGAFAHAENTEAPVAAGTEVSAPKAEVAMVKKEKVHKKHIKKEKSEKSESSGK